MAKILNLIHIGSRMYVNPNELLYLESDINYTYAHLLNGRKILSSTTLKIIENRLLPFKNFIRINRQTIINRDLIPSKDQSTFLLPDNRIVRFSRRKQQAFLEISKNAQK